MVQFSGVRSRQDTKILIPDFTDDTDYNYGMKIVIKKLLGVVLVIIGLAALLTPLTPGSWLALIGLELLGLRLLIERKFLKEKHRASIARFMERFGYSSSGGNKTGRKKD
jgi:hypothetical protein